MTNNKPTGSASGFHLEKVFVVIVNWNGKEFLKKCLTTVLLNTVYPEYQVVVVDNGSVDGSVEMVKKEFSTVNLIENSENLGFSKANNQGIKHALFHGAKYVLLLNSDVEIAEKEWLENMVNLSASDSTIGIVGCKLVYPNGLIQHAGGVVNLEGAYNRGDGEKDKKQYEKVELVDFVTG